MEKKSTEDPFFQREAEKYEHPIPSREFILDWLKTRRKPSNYQEILQALKLEGEIAEEALYRRLKAMIRDQQLDRLKGGYFWPTEMCILLEGKVISEKGKAWVLPVDGSARILLSNEGLFVYPGNRVKVSLFDIPISPEENRIGKVVEIIEQQRLRVAGRFIAEHDYCYVIPQGKEINHDILIPKDKTMDAKDGYIVVIELSAQNVLGGEPQGEVVEVLGHENTPGIEIEAAIRGFGLPYHWPEAVESMALEFDTTVSSAAKRNRMDLRALPLVTIDGEDAKDFDDAVFCEPKSKGGWRLYVAIADVSFYVRPNTPLDKEAQERGNSVYFPGRVIPMLPEVLSNGLCSLNPQVDRLCMVCEMQIGADGKLTRYEFYEGLMCSKARLTYTKVAAILANESSHLVKQYESVVPHLQDLSALYEALRKQREIRGAIEFESSETRIIFGDNGKINRIEPVERNIAHRIIEECMLCANVATARFLKKHKLPGLYRNHEGPPPDKLADLRVFLGELGLSLEGGKTPEPLDYAKLLRSVKSRPDANVIQTVLLRSLSQATYSPENLGHFGLAYPAYSHFTSPIRRYPDLLVHRQIRQVLRGKWDPALEEKNIKKTEAASEALIAIGERCSLTERRADDATRDVVRWLKCEYIQKQIGETFEGVISGVTRFGFFAELKNIYIDGLVHVTSLKNDYYFFDTVHHLLIGERSGVVHKMGDNVLVKVARVSIDERKIDFELIENLTKHKKGDFVQKKPTPKNETKTSDPKKKKRKRSRSSKLKKNKGLG